MPRASQSRKGDDMFTEEALDERDALDAFIDDFDAQKESALQEYNSALNERLDAVDSLIGVECILSGMRTERNNFGVKAVRAFSRTRADATPKRQKFTGRLAQQLVERYETGRDNWPARIYLEFGLFKVPFTTDDGQEMYRYGIARRPADDGQ